MPTLKKKHIKKRRRKLRCPGFTLGHEGSLRLWICAKLAVWNSENQMWRSVRTYLRFCKAARWMWDIYTYRKFLEEKILRFLKLNSNCFVNVCALDLDHLFFVQFYTNHLVGFSCLASIEWDSNYLIYLKYNIVWCVSEGKESHLWC